MGIFTPIVKGIRNGAAAGMAGVVTQQALENVTSARLPHNPEFAAIIQGAVSVTAAALAFVAFEQMDRKESKEAPANSQLAEPVHEGMMQRNQVRLQLTDVAAR